MSCDWCERPVGASHAVTCPLKGYVTEPSAPSEGGTGDEIAKLRAEIARLREGRRWVSVGERLPEDNVGVLAWGPCNGGAEMVWREHGKWHLSFVGTYIPDSTYTHWMPLPPGPEVVHA